MLTKNDLQQIGNIIKGAIDPLKQDVGTLKQDVGTLKQDMVVVKKNLRGLKIKTTHIQNTLNIAIKMFDKTDNNHEKRLKKIEDHLGFIAS